MRKLNENQDITKLLSETDFSQESMNKDMIRDQLFFKLAQHQGNVARTRPASKKGFRFRPVMISAAALALILSFSMIAYGENIIRIIKELSLGNIKYSVRQTREMEPLEKSLPPELKGQLFDKEGNELSSLPDNEEAYTKDGQPAQVLWDNDKQIFIIYQGEPDKMLTSETLEESLGESAIKNIDDARPYLAFDLKMPVFPEGYSFDYAMLGSEMVENEVRSLGYWLTNADKTNQIMVLVTMADDPSVELTATENMEEVTINGHKALLDKAALTIEIDGVVYTFMTPLTREDVIKMAESLE